MSIFDGFIGHQMRVEEMIYRPEAISSKYIANLEDRVAKLEAALERIAIGAKPAPLIARKALAKEGK